MNKYFKILIQSLIISVIAVFLIDYFAHLFLSIPMETIPYFLIKFLLYFVFAFIFLMIFRKAKFYQVALGGILVGLFFGFYYNILPLFTTNYPIYGIPLSEISFLGRGIFLTGLAFGIIHTLGFLVGFYASKSVDLIKNIKNV